MQMIPSTNGLTADEAAAILGVEVKNLAPLLARYGVGRHYEARHGDEFVYDRADIEKVRSNLATLASGAPPT